MHVVVLYPELFTSPIVNILTSLEHLAAQGLITLHHSREDRITPQQIAAADVLVGSRNVDPVHKPIYEYAKALGIPIIYDLDDNLFAVPPGNELYHYFRHPDKQAQLRWILQSADLVRVHSPALADVVSPYNARVEVVWAAVNWDDVPENLPPLTTTPLDIVYSVSPHSGAMFFSLIRDDLLQVLVEFPDRVRFHALGYADPDFLKLPNVTNHPYQQDFRAFFRDFTRQGYAVGLAPMKLDTFYQCKTDLKFRDYAAAGAAGIYTRCPLYAQVEHEITGILVDNQPGAWYNAIVDLLEHPEKIDNIRQAAREFAFNRYHVQVTSQIWLRDLQSLRKHEVPLLTEHPQTWWFTRTNDEVSPVKQRLLKIYNAVVPFRVHVIASRVYRWLRRLRR